jgi:hypothetical protein
MDAAEKAWEAVIGPRPTQPPARPQRPKAVKPVYRRKGAPCTETNEAFRGADRRKMIPGGIIQGPKVSGGELMFRVFACERCEHVSELSTGALICECVQCERWHWPDRRKLNEYQDAPCPRMVPAW